MQQQLSLDQREEQREQLRELFRQAIDLRSDSYAHLVERDLSGYDQKRDELFQVRMKFYQLVSSL
jgi:Fe-S cluster assembly ATPase SufC